MSIEEDIAKVKENPMLLNSLKNRNNEDVILAAVKTKGEALKFVSDELKTKQIVLAAINKDAWAIQYAGQWKNDKEVALLAVEKEGFSLEYVSGHLLDDPEIILASIASTYGRSLKFSNLKNNKDFVLKSLQVHKKSLRYASEEIKNDPEVIKIATTMDLENLEFMGTRLKEDVAFCKYMIENFSANAFLYFSDTIKTKEFCLELIYENPWYIKVFPDAMKRDADIIFGSLSNPDVLEFIVMNIEDFLLNSSSIRKIDITIYAQKHPIFLKLVPEKYETRDQVLNAINENGESLQYAGIFIDDPEIIKIAILNNPNVLKKMPELLLNRELIHYLMTTSVKVLTVVSELIPKKEIKPLFFAPPELRRQYSKTFTNQTNEGSCNRHAYSKTIMKNVFEFFNPYVITDIYTENKCNEYLTTPSSNISTLTPEKCSHGGYIKILLFLHLYYLYKCLLPHPGETLSSENARDIFPHLYYPSSIPNITTPQYNALKHELDRMKEISHTFHIHLATFYVDYLEMTFEQIQRIIQLGLYIRVRVDDSKTDDQHAGHALVIVGIEGDVLLIKNSWGDEILYKIKFQGPLLLDDHCYTISQCSIIIPVQAFEDVYYRNISNLYEYLDNYERLKDKINTSLVTTDYFPETVDVPEETVTGPCPSHNKKPVNCIDRKNFLKQAILFHPDKNSGCKLSATAKFKTLKNLPGCKEQTKTSNLQIESERLPLKAGTRRRKKKILRKSYKRYHG